MDDGLYYARPRSGATREDPMVQSMPLVSKAKGKIYKGTPFQYLKGSMEDKGRIQELHAVLEDNNQQILLQKLEVRSLKD